MLILVLVKQQVQSKKVTSRSKTCFRVHAFKSTHHKHNPKPQIQPPTTYHVMMIIGLYLPTTTSGSLGAGGFSYTTFAIAQLLIDCSLNNILNRTTKSVLSISLRTPILYRLPVGMTDNGWRTLFCMTLFKTARDPDIIVWRTQRPKGYGRRLKLQSGRRQESLRWWWVSRYRWSSSTFSR